MTLCFYPKRQNFKEGPLPGLAKILGAPLSNSERKALMFTPNLEKYSKLDNQTLQSIVQWALLLMQICMSVCIIIPIILNKETAGLILAAYTGLMLLGEVLIVLMSFFAVSISIFNLFFLVQLVCGILRKASFLALALLSGICIRSQGLVGIIVGVLALVFMLCE